MQSASLVARLAGCSVHLERMTIPGLELSDSCAAHLLFLLLSLVLPPDLPPDLLLPGLLKPAAKLAAKEAAMKLAI